MSEILSFTKDVYNTYIQAPEKLQKRFIDFFFNSFEVKDGVIIKFHYSPLFEELMRLKVVDYKNPYLIKTLKTKADSEVIIRPKLGRYHNNISEALKDGSFMDKILMQIRFLKVVAQKEAVEF